MSSRDLWVDSGLSLRKEIRENISLLLCMCGGGIKRNTKGEALWTYGCEPN